MNTLADVGWDIFNPGLPDSILTALRDSAFTTQGPGQRCLLDFHGVRQAAVLLRAEMIRAGFLSNDAVAIQAIAFDKTPGSNWKVPWHQDVMFPFAQRPTTTGYDLVSKKDGVDYSRSPKSVLEQMIAARLHLDDCDTTNGPLRVSPGSHREGVIKSADLSTVVTRYGEVPCLAKAGEIVLMKSLLLHSSSAATAPRRRRGVHFVYYSGLPIAEKWHRAVR